MTDTSSTNQVDETRCTWVDCRNEAKHPRADSAGRAWSNVCDFHDSQMKRAAIEAFESGGQRGTAKLASMWVKAQGGAKKAADRALGRIHK